MDSRIDFSVLMLERTQVRCMFSFNADEPMQSGIIVIGNAGLKLTELLYSRVNYSVNCGEHLVSCKSPFRINIFSHQ